eukprot:5852902-Pleurochrysis_carterae.AAC.6
MEHSEERGESKGRLQEGFSIASPHRPAPRVHLGHEGVYFWRHVRAELGGSQRGWKVVWCASEYGQGHPQSSTTLDRPRARRHASVRSDRCHSHGRPVCCSNQKGSGANIYSAQSGKG